ncbi:MAG: benzoate-CoA ligase family protein [Ardenticatenaceae bacterium]|nr:benzoate-CoA ligase family protein [Ardenticatenaceae bacterium]
MRASDLPLYYNAVDILERNLAARADKVALYSLEREMTFRQVSEEANQVGGALRGLGVRIGEYVGLLSLDGPEWVTSFFGTLKIGAIAVGMNTLLTPREYAYMLNDSRARVLIVHESLVPAIEEVRDQLPFLEHIIVIGPNGREGYRSYTDWIRSQPTELQTVGTHRDDFCSLNYSSGTTGQPKGILHAHKDYPLTAQLWGVNVLGLREDDRTFAVAKLFFTFGLGGNLIFPWYAGASVVLFAGAPRIVENVLKTIDRFKPTILYNAPTGYAAALAQDELTEKYDLSSLRLCASAGEALPAPIWHAWKERTGVDIIDGIGSTENFHIFLSNRPGDIRPGSSGKPFDGYELRIVDEQGSELPRGEVGNLWVKGQTAALFYLHEYEKSQQTFRGEWLVTGDKYYIDEDGYYWHAGRSDDMLKVGGIWVSPVEVESTLLSHPAVLECAVVGQADDANLIKPKAFVTLKSGYSPSDGLAQEMIEFCREQMAAYKRPRWIEFVAELPKTATGKIQRFRLREESRPGGSALEP